MPLNWGRNSGTRLNFSKVRSRSRSAFCTWALAAATSACICATCARILATCASGEPGAALTPLTAIAPAIACETP